MTRKITSRELYKAGRKPLSLEAKENSKEKRKLWENAWKKQYCEYNPQKKLLWAARRRAKEKSIDCTITEADIVIPIVCPYLGSVLEHTAKRGTDRGSVMSLDRIDPTIGYIPGNIEVISHRANTMKSNATKEQLVDFAKRILIRFRCRDIDDIERTSL